MFARLTALAGLFLKLGTIGFGGPAVHIALMQDEVVERRRWLDRQQFLDLIAATNLIPGPNSTEMAIHIGYLYGGFCGLIVAGACFLVPAVSITMLLAWAYVEFGQVPQIQPVIDGMKPVVLVIILAAGWKLGQKAIKSKVLGFVAGLAALMTLSHHVTGTRISEITALLAASLVGAVLVRLTTSTASAASVLWPVPQGISAITMAAQSSPELTQLSLFFLKVGAVLYGTGYVLVAYLRGGLVDELGWLTEGQLLDAIAIGQFTPGPILSTATFIGYVVMSPEGSTSASVMGAICATVAIFLPSFLFVAISGPLIPRLRRNPTAAAILDAVGAASLGLMAAVVLSLGWTLFFPANARLPVDLTAVLISAAAAVLVFRWKVASIWLILGGGLAGLISAWIQGTFS